MTRLWLYFAVLVVISGNIALVSAGDGVVYSTQIAPVLRTYCVSCHSRVEAQNGLSLQAPDDILKGSENGIVLDLKNPADSRLLRVLTGTGDDHMPPSDEPQPSAEELTLLTKWISQGAAFDSRLVVMPDLPKVAITSAFVRQPALTMAVTADGKSVVLGKYKSVELRNTETGTVSWSHRIPDGKVEDVRLSADEKRVLLATGTPGLSGRAVEMVIGESEIRREFSGHNDMLYAAVWSPDESVVATAGYDRRIILHSAHTGAKLRELTGHNGAIFDLCFSPDGSLLASASADATIKIWDVRSGERFDTLGQPQSEQYAVLFSPDGRFIYAAGSDSRIRSWQLVSRTGPQINPLLISRFAHEGSISSMTMSRDGRYLATASDTGSIKIWDALAVSEVSADTLSNDLVSSLAFDDTGAQLVVATSRGAEKRIPLPELKAVAGSASPDAVTSAMIETASLAIQSFAEIEPNNDFAAAQTVVFPATITGLIDGADALNADCDIFRFDAKKGQQMLLEVKASRDNSPLDSAIEVLDGQGQPVLQAQLQAVRDSYFTFRGKDSDTSDDFRVFNWQEMDLNEYLYADGEVVKLWLYPRGPDSGYKVYPGFGNRETYFGTTPTSHPLQGPAFIVNAFAADAQLRDTGLPVFNVYYENDDDSMRQWGRDSRLVFTPPADGTFVVRLKDARGFQGTDYKYQLLIRSPQPDFTVAQGGEEISIHPGTGRELSFTTTRLDGYTGPIEIFAENLPAGFSLSDPVLIQDEQRQAFAILIAAPDVAQPADDAVSQIRFKARATIGGHEVVHEIGGLKSIKLQEKPKVLVKILSDELHTAGTDQHSAELTVWAGETVRAFLKVERQEHNGLVEFGKEDSGRNMPHGVFVDNIGLNGLMLLDGQNEREFFITTAKWVPESSRPFYLKSSVDGITSMPVMLHIRHRTSVTRKSDAAE